MARDRMTDLPAWPDPLTDVSDDGLRRAIEADNIATRTRNADIAVEAHHDGDADWAIAPLGDIYRSVVVRAAFTPDSADRRIEEIVAAFDARRTGIVWWRSPLDTPDDLGERLLRHGFQHFGDSPAMALDLATLRDEPQPLDGFELAQITDVGALREYLAVVHAERPEGGPPYPPGITEMTVERVGPLLGREPIATRFLGRLDGRAVATSRLSLAAGVAGIYTVVTVPDARGRGIGRQMTLAPLLAAREAGYRIATLQSSELGLPVYRGLGFRELFRFAIHVRPPLGAEPPTTPSPVSGSEPSSA